MRPAPWIVAFATMLATACRDDSCLEGHCERPCEDVTYTASALCQLRVDRPLYVGLVRDAPPEYLLARGGAAASDVVMTNGIVTAVVSGIDAPNDLAPTGGNLIDFGPYGGSDDLGIMYQLAGILPDDAFAYRSLTYATVAGGVSVTARGTLDGRPDVEVVTHYELDACDEGVRVRSELFNGSADVHTWVIADGMHWGRRRMEVFVPARDQGFKQPELKLLELTSLWSPYDFAAEAASTDDAPSYASLACDRGQLAGVNDLEISALGTPMTYVAPGDTITLERILYTAGTGQGVAPAAELARGGRTQLFGEATEEVTGRVVAGGIPFGGDVRRASVVIYADDVPATSIVPADDGTFAVRVPQGARVHAEVWSFGRPVASGDGAALGDIEVPEPATVQLAVTLDGDGDWSSVVFVPDDDITRAAVTGTFHGRFTECAPWLGPPHGSSPACNRVTVPPQGIDVEVPAGNYLVVAAAGPERTIATAHITLTSGEITPVALALQSLQLVPDGWLSADFHVHGRRSFDSGIPDVDRVRTFVAEDVDVIAATDHDVIGDYTQTVNALGLDDRIAVMGGLEATQLIPWMDVEGESLPRVIGHMNFWPLVETPSEPRAGAPWDELMEPGQLFDVMAPLVGANGMMQLNHAWAEPLFGRDLGYLRAINFDPRLPLDEGPNRVLLRRPGGNHRNLDWNVIEVLNGCGISELMSVRQLWFSLLAQGVIAPGTGNSDSHGMTDGQLGWARNWVQAPTTVDVFSADSLNAAVRDGRVIAGNGVVVLVEIVRANGTRRGLGFAPHTLQPGDQLDITVRAAPWIPIDEVRVVTSRGTKIVAENPPATLERFHGQIPLATLVDRDDFIVVEAGLAYPLAADLDDDGVLDTTDNNGDGRVDDDDVDEDEDTGPLTAPPDPTDTNDRRYLLTRLVPGAWPEGFANPVFIDVDGGGWSAPGLRP